MRISLADAFTRLAPLIGSAALTDAGFGHRLVDFLKSVARFDHCVAFAYRGQAKPIALFDTFTEAERHVFVTLYQPGPYLLDPFFRTASIGKVGFWRMRELAPDRFYSSEYFRSYYVKTGLAEETGFFVRTDNAVMVVLSLMRLKRSGLFSAAEATALKACEPVVSACIARHWRGIDGRFRESAPAAPSARQRPFASRPVAVAAWQALSLTTREAHIVDLVLQGHSSDSIAWRLGIAAGTVKVHRRNIYRKLGISSQTELLSIYVDRIVGHTAPELSQ
jgi:DNA-binding CsgD family transcriptional regulator